MAQETAAAKAFKAAQKAIAEAAKSGVTELRLAKEALRSLNSLPEEIATLTRLTGLYIPQTKVGEITPLRDMTWLKRLSLADSKVSDLEPLRGLTGLKWLHLGDTAVSDLEPLQGLTGLESLYLRNTDVSDLEPLRGLTGLKLLELNGTSVNDLVALRGLTRLTELSLSGTRVNDLEPLRGLTKLTKLILTVTDVSDLEPLRNLTELTMLSVDGTEVADLTLIADLPGLRFLDISETEVGRVELLQLRNAWSLIPPVRMNGERGPPHEGIWLENCRAAYEDATIAKIAAIDDNRARTIALFEELGLDWREGALEPGPQSDTGLRYAPDDTGVITYDPSAAVEVLDTQQRQLHVLLREDAGELQILFGGGHNQPFARVTRKLERYSAGLGDDLDRLNPSLLWKTGNDLRLMLKADKDRSPGDMTHNLPFDVDQRAGLEGLVSAHNALVALHPALSKLDEVSVDPAVRHVAERDRALMQAAIDAFAQQTRLIMAEVVSDLRDLHEQAMGETRAAMRAGRIEVESLENLIKAILTEAILEARGESTLGKVAGDVRAAAVGTVAVGVATLAGPALAATYIQLVAALQPHMAALMAAWHGKDYPVTQAVEWVMRRIRG